MRDAAFNDFHVHWIIPTGEWEAEWRPLKPGRIARRFCCICVNRPTLKGRWVSLMRCSRPCVEMFICCLHAATRPGLLLEPAQVLVFLWDQGSLNMNNPPPILRFQSEPLKLDTFLPSGQTRGETHTHDAARAVCVMYTREPASLCWALGLIAVCCLLICRA